MEQIYLLNISVIWWEPLQLIIELSIKTKSICRKAIRNFIAFKIIIIYHWVHLTITRKTSSWYFLGINEDRPMLFDSASLFFTIFQEFHFVWKYSGTCMFILNLILSNNLIHGGCFLFRICPYSKTGLRQSAPNPE